MPVKAITKVRFHSLVPVSLRNRTALKSFISMLLKREGRGLEQLSIIFCSDEYLLSINQSYLSHDYYTDIITFDLADQHQSSGEIYISIPRVKDNAQRFQKSFTEELHRVIFHGVLHLCGYKDKNAVQEKEMRSKEDKALRMYFK